MCVAPGRTSGAWISSLTTRAPCFSARSRIPSSSARVCTWLHGLCGLVSSSVRAPSANSRSRWSRSSTYSSPSGVTGRSHCGRFVTSASPSWGEYAGSGSTIGLLSSLRTSSASRTPGGDVDGRQHLPRVDLVPEVPAGEPGVRLAELATAQVEPRVAELAPPDRVPERRDDRLGHRVVHLGDPRRDHARLGHAPLERRRGPGLVVGEIADHGCHPCTCTCCRPCQRASSSWGRARGR